MRAWAEGLLSDVGCARPWYQPEFFHALFSLEKRAFALIVYSEGR